MRKNRIYHSSIVRVKISSIVRVKKSISSIVRVKISSIVRVKKIFFAPKALLIKSFRDNPKISKYYIL